MNKIFSNIIKVKNPDEMIESANRSGLKKTLNVVDLIMLGIGAIVGSGIFTVVGIAASGSSQGPGAGPALIISMVIAALACIFSAFCYCEFASMIPVAGSAYTYTYATLGEFAAWMIGWVLMLEYAIGFIAVCSAWTGYLFQFLKGFTFLPHCITNPPIWLINDLRSTIAQYNKLSMNYHDHIPHILGNIPFSINLPGILMTIFLGCILIKGIKESTKIAGLMVAIKLTVIGLFILTGAFYVKPENWVPFAPNGLSGIFMGAFIIFFAYIGFDAIATTAEESKNPQRDLPIGILGSLGVCTVVYTLVALVLTGMVPIDKIDLHAPIAHVMRLVGQNWVAGLISLGAFTGLSSVLLVLMLASTRVLYAMARDNFLPKVFQKVHPKYQTPHIITIFVCALSILGSLFLDINIAAELCNFGTFTSFIIVCIAILILRKTDPNRERPFKVPFSPWLPLCGILCCSSLMLYSMKFLTTSRYLFPIWLLIGIFIYFSYGYRANRRQEVINTRTKTERERTSLKV